MLALHYMPNTLGYARLGIVVGKKTAKRAVQRNYMKRTLREFFRQACASLGAVDLLIRPLKAYSRSDFDAVRLEFDALLGQLQRRTRI